MADALPLRPRRAQARRHGGPGRVWTERHGGEGVVPQMRLSRHQTGPDVAARPQILPTFVAYPKILRIFRAWTQIAAATRRTDRKTLKAWPTLRFALRRRGGSKEYALSQRRPWEREATDRRSLAKKSVRIAGWNGQEHQPRKISKKVHDGSDGYARPGRKSGDYCCVSPRLAPGFPPNLTFPGSVT